MLGKHARPVFPVRRHFYISFFGSEPDPFVSTDDDDVSGDLVDDLGVLKVAGDPQAINTSRVK
jgi:hypothetical protein